MKPIAFGIFLIFATLPVVAFPGSAATYLPAELKAVEAEYGTRNLGELKVNDLIPVARRLDVAQQKDWFVGAAGGLSMLWPGAGQFMAGDATGGVLHTTLHVGVTAAALFWAHSLLPDDLRWGNLDYPYTDSKTIEATWKSHRPADFLPAAGALAAGFTVDLVVRAWSARDAQYTAKARIDSGDIGFEPRFFEGGRLGLGWRMRL